MVKKGPLGKAEQFYIKEQYKEMSVDDMCKELDRAKTLVKRHVTKCKKQEDKEAENSFTVGSQFGVRNGSVVMTQNASQMSDDIKSSSTKITSRQSACITGTGKKNEKK